MNTLEPGAVSPSAARIYGTAMVAAPLLLLASTVAYITDGNGINDGVLGGTIGVWSCFALAIAFVGLLRILEPVAPKAAPRLTMVAIAGFATGVAFNVQAIFTAYFGPEISEFFDTVDGADAWAILAFLPWGWFAPVTFFATGILLWRVRSVASWQAASLALAGVLFIASRPARIDPLAVVADLTLIIALVPIGWSMLTHRQQTAPLAAPIPA